MTGEVGVFQDVDRPADTDIGPAPFLGLQLAYPIIEELWLEWGMGYAWYDFDGEVDSQQVTLQESALKSSLGLKYLFKIRHYSPWISGGVGWTRIGTDKKSLMLRDRPVVLGERIRSDFASSLGLGCNYRWRDDLTLTGGVNLTDVSQEGRDFKFLTITAGAVYAF